MIALIIGPFLPYFVTEFEFGNEIVTNNYSYINFEGWGLYMLFPFLFALIFLILLYLKIDIYMENDSKITNIKPLITLAIGFWFFMVHIADAARFNRDYGYSRMYPGVGIMLIIAGYFLCGLAGFLNWRKRTEVVEGAPPKEEMEREVVTKSTPQPYVESSQPVTPTELEEEKVIRRESIKPKPLYPSSSSTPISYVEEYQIQSKFNHPLLKEQKVLLNWAKRLDRHRDIYEKCMKCGKYGFIEVKDTGLSLTFTCPNCNERFTLKK